MHVAADDGRALRARAPDAIGSYAFWLRADERRVRRAAALPPLYTSGVEVDRALAAALAHQGLAVAGP